MDILLEKTEFMDIRGPEHRVNSELSHKPETQGRKGKGKDKQTLGDSRRCPGCGCGRKGFGLAAAGYLGGHYETASRSANRLWPQTLQTGKCLLPISLHNIKSYSMPSENCGVCLRDMTSKAIVLEFQRRAEERVREVDRQYR